MDTIWTNLPLELSEYICNQLSKVRRIPESLKREIEERVHIVREVEYPVSSGLARAYNCLQIPTEGVRYTFGRDGFVLNMCARVVKDGDDGWWLWFPLGSATSLGRYDSPIRVKF
jgi:hypothetical protein